MKTDAPKVIKLSEYKKPDYLVETIDLVLHLDNTKTLVQSTMKIKRNTDEVTPLILNGEELVLKSIKLNNETYTDYVHSTENHSLTLNKVPAEFTLMIENEINPEANKTLDGLYKSGTIFCTQNEPEGFRRITFYVDRPDNMAKFTTKIVADKKLYPILLSNGNPIARGDLEGGKHFVTWEDPFKKPAYLYALVAGDLGVIKDTFKTKSGRNVALEIYCDKGNENKCHHAMESLKKSMKWDEDRFGLEYDLDIYMIVAVDAFNMGAMENKGLNIFNSAYVLADQKSATDTNFYGIESVIGHEYFHNWTGNRITCRDWFQLTLKEGLTVFRDQEFSADMNSRSVERIQSVMGLRAAQFAEDAGPTSHPIKPATYMEINNFYTATIYEKGAEVIRMIQTLLGVDGFRKGMDKYFELFDGQAVRTEDFIHAMSVANNNFDFTQFKNWYGQNGTPLLKATSKYDEAAKRFTLTLTQTLPANAPKDAKAYHMPVRVGLIDSTGKDIASKVLELKETTQDFVFENITSKPIASVNREFSAPVKLTTDLTFDEQLFLMAHDSDSFNRFEAAQVVSTKLILDLIEDAKAKRTFELNSKYVEAFGKILADNTIDEAFKALSMSIPGEGVLHQEQAEIAYPETEAVRTFVKKTLATAHQDTLVKLYKSIEQKEYKLDPKSMGQRDLKNKCLDLLSYVEGGKYNSLAFDHFKAATNMTDEIGALTTIVHANSVHKDEALKAFYDKWKHETLVMQKWLTVQASASDESTYDAILKLEKDAVYDRTIPNLVRALLGQFVATNKVQFNHPSGRGYKLIADRLLELDKLNPQVASRLASGFKDFKRTPKVLQDLMRPELERIIKTDGLSKNVYEIVSKILG
ncbi:aminopeptidase N [Bacteriovorax stolpii]|uniref:Aminopeptidase N n=1 Tax=Bacteriovorax stolpii TaxID=960 RepID=A0A2K9NQZ1_BACTC|nr:aminopeptidase N [Bacteriovorax stolpii]AUN97923.1 aminopeptidase N [Bacteriovorax stolpii]TDP51754.1 aminopeptidase N [Bacteriovorax stolpii]